MLSVILLLVSSLYAASEAEKTSLSVAGLQPLLEDITKQKNSHEAAQKLQKFLEEATHLGVKAVEATKTEPSEEKMRELKEDIHEGILEGVEVFNTPLDID